MYTLQFSTGIMFVFDITNRKSYKNIKHWVYELARVRQHRCFAPDDLAVPYDTVEDIIERRTGKPKNACVRGYIYLVSCLNISADTILDKKATTVGTWVRRHGTTVDMTTAPPRHIGNIAYIPWMCIVYSAAAGCAHPPLTSRKPRMTAALPLGPPDTCRHQIVRKLRPVVQYGAELLLDGASAAARPRQAVI